MGKWYKNKWVIILILVLITLIIVGSLGLFNSQKKSASVQSLYTTNLNEATLLPTTKMELLYSYSLNSGGNANSGFFTVVVDGPFQIPNITYEVRDQTNRLITSGETIVGKTTVINFEGTSNTRNADLYIYSTGSNISLKNLTVTLNNSSLYTI